MTRGTPVLATIGDYADPSDKRGRPVPRTVTSSRAASRSNLHGRIQIRAKRGTSDPTLGVRLACGISGHILPFMACFGPFGPSGVALGVLFADFLTIFAVCGAVFGRFGLVLDIFLVVFWP